MATALASLLSGRPVRHTVGMTGEVTLQGRVLPIGGLKQKVLAAHAAGLTDVILPERNRADLDDVPEHVRDEMTFHPVMSLGEVLELALEPAAHAPCAVGAAHPCPRRFAARRTSSSGAGRSRSSTPPTRARRASTSSGRPSGTIPPRTLAQRLVELEEAGVLDARGRRAAAAGRVPADGRGPAAEARRRRARRRFAAG